MILPPYAAPLRGFRGTADTAAAVTLEPTDQGGHGGGAFPGTLAWTLERLLEHFGSATDMR